MAFLRFDERVEMSIDGLWCKRAESVECGGRERTSRGGVPRTRSEAGDKGPRHRSSIFSPADAGPFLAYPSLVFRAHLRCRSRVSAVGVVLLAVLCSVASPRVPSAADAFTVRPTWRTVSVPGAEARVVGMFFDGSTWWFSGSTRDPSGVQRPAVWTSSDLVSVTPMVMRPVTPYGEISEIYAIAAARGGAVALGMHTGGAHGNPRTGSWVLSSSEASPPTMGEVKANFELYNGPRQIGVRSVAAVPSGGWVIFGSRVNRNGLLGATSWWSADGSEFAIFDDDPVLSAGVGQQHQGLDVAADGPQLLAVGEQFAVRGGVPSTDAVVWTSTDGRTWMANTDRRLRDGGDGEQRFQRVAVSGDGAVIGGTDSAVRTRLIAWERRGGKWHRSVLPLPSSDDALSGVTDVAIDGTVALVGAKVDERLLLVTRPVGGRWRRAILPAAPTGRRAQLQVGIGGANVVVAAMGDGPGWLVVADRAALTRR